MQGSIRNKLSILAGIVCVALLCVTCITVSFAAWLIDSSVTVDGAAALLYVDYPNVVASTTEEVVEPECPADNSKSKKFVFSDGAKIVFVGLNYTSSINCHIWKSSSVGTTWPGTTLDGGTYNCGWKIAETQGIIFVNGSGNANRTGDNTAFWDAHFKDNGGLKDNYIYTIDFTKLNNCNNTTTSATLKTNIPVQSRESKETHTEISHGDKNKLVREVRADNKDAFRNYVCVSRTEKFDEDGELVEVTDPSFAYVNFSVDGESADLDASVKSFTVTRRRTDENGVPMSGSFDVSVYGSPSGKTLKDINNTYVMLDFGLGSERFNALDFLIETETEASYTLTATATYRDEHTYQVANSCYLGFGDWTMREPVLMSGLVESNYVDVSVTATLSAGDGFKMFGSGSGSGSSITIAKYFKAVNYKFSDGIEDNFTTPSDTSNIMVNTSGRYLIRYYGAIMNISGSDWSVENVEITLLTASDDKEEIVITCEDDLTKLDGITAADLYSTPIILDIEDENDALYGKSLTVITSAADLAAMEGTDKPNVYYYQSNDISGAPRSALYTNDTQFGGIYNGGGHEIKTVSAPDGLFGYIGEKGVVKNVSITVGISSASQDYIGGVAAVNNGTVKNVTVDGSISSTVGTVNTDGQKTEYGTGGIVGKNRAGGVIVDCVNNAKVSGKLVVGGIVGYNMADATVENSKNTGLVGTTTTTVNMTGCMSWAGGLVGYNCGTVYRSINDGNVSAYKGNDNSDGNGNNFLSGLVAENAASGVITECINTGKVYGDYAIAGFAALNYGTIEYCINTGNVEARWEASGGTCQGTSGVVKNSVVRGGVTASQNNSDNKAYAVNGAGTATNCYYVKGTASGTGNKKYDVSTIDKVVEMLDVLGDKFAYDGEHVTLAYLTGAAKLTFTAGGEPYKIINIVSGITFDLTKISAPTSETLVFRGWYLAGDEEKAYITEYTVVGDVELVADMGKKQFTVVFYVDGGDEVWDTVTADFDEEIIPPDAPMKDGYTFGGWFEDGAEEEFDFTAERSSNVSLKAKWTAIVYTVTFDANGGTIEQETKEVAFETAFGDLPTPTTELDGYRFGGWYTQKGEEGDDESWGEKVTANTVYTTVGGVTLYAKWEQGAKLPKFEYKEVDGGIEITGIDDALPERLEIPSEYKGKTVVSIAAGAFNKSGVDYSGVKSIVVPRSVKTIGAAAFGGCKNIESITIPFAGAEEGYSSTDNKRMFGYIFSSSVSQSNHNTTVPSSLKTVIIADGCKTIQTAAFRCNSNQTLNFVLVIPESVTTISNSYNNYITAVYYKGTEVPSIITTAMSSATVYCYSEEPPTGAGNYWRYVDDVPTAW